MVALSKHFKRSNLAQKIFELHAWIKSAILAIFQAGLGWPCPVNAALKNASWHLKILFVFGGEYLERLEGKNRNCLFFYAQIF